MVYLRNSLQYLRSTLLYLKGIFWNNLRWLETENLGNEVQIALCASASDNWTLYQLNLEHLNSISLAQTGASKITAGNLSTVQVLRYFIPQDRAVTDSQHYKSIMHKAQIVGRLQENMPLS